MTLTSMFLGKGFGIGEMLFFGVCDFVPKLTLCGIIASWGKPYNSRKCAFHPYCKESAHRLGFPVTRGRSCLFGFVGLVVFGRTRHFSGREGPRSRGARDAFRNTRFLSWTGWTALPHRRRGHMGLSAVPAPRPMMETANSQRTLFETAYDATSRRLSLMRSGRTRARSYCLLHEPALFGAAEDLESHTAISVDTPRFSVTSSQSAY